jgi:NAD(P)H-dependent flavin oxidoreductase YrpB (nitropropane dioxygenase family)
MLKTRFCERFGIDAPIMVAPMGPDLTGPELVAAICNAGGFGVLRAQLCPPPLLQQRIRYLRTLTTGPFGVALAGNFNLSDEAEDPRGRENRTPAKHPSPASCARRGEYWSGDV